MLQKLKKLEEEYESLTHKLAEPTIIQNQNLYKQYMRRRNSIEPTVFLYRELQKIEKAVSDTEILLKTEEGEELRKMAEEELHHAKAKKNSLMEKLKIELLPKDPNDDKDCIMEIRAGAGGDEATLFAADLLRMYLRYAERHGYKTEFLAESRSEKSGVKEVIFRASGNKAYGKMKYESGVHRVQRIPETEAKGRIHTSTATVAVLPEAEEVDVEIRPEDIKIDTFRAGGAGGQHVNKTESAVRITHLKTGLTASCQDDRSQLKNKEKAMKILRARLFALEEEKRRKETGEMRSSQIGTGDRSEKIRTYNIPQDRVTDHRIKANFSNVKSILDGEIDDIVEKLIAEDHVKLLAASVK